MNTCQAISIEGLLPSMDQSLDWQQGRGGRVLLHGMWPVARGTSATAEM